jgi:hypothetical protein
LADIIVTQSVVKDLATILARSDTISMKHTERLNLIAGAFGWRVDAFMHALKESAPAKSSGSTRTISDPILMTSHTRQAMKATLASLTRSPGVFFVCGPERSGKTTTLEAAATELVALGWRRSGKGSSTADSATFHVIDGIDDLAGVRDACRLAASGVIVLASILSTVHLWGFGYHAVDDLEYRFVRGLMCQRLVPRTSDHCTECERGHHRGYALVAEVSEFDFAGKPFEYAQIGKADGRFVRDAIRSAKAGHIHLREAEKAFGKKNIDFVIENYTGFQLDRTE